MRLRSTAPAAAMLLLASLVAPDAALAQSAPTCAAPANTLSYACESACADVYTPCWLNATASTTTCQYQCYNKIYSAAGDFILLVPYGRWKSSTQLAYEATMMPTAAPYKPGTMIIGDTANYSWTSNDNLEKIETLKLRSSTTNVYLTGGSYIGTYFWKGQVANVELAPDLLTTQTQVTLVLLRNLNLASYTAASKLAAMLPRSLVHIAVNNALLTEFPTGFARLTLLRRLYLNYNFIETVDSTMGLPGIQELELVNNKLVSFNAVFKDLAILGLSVNRLTDVPSVVAEHTLLQQLWLNNNSLSDFPESLDLPKLKTLYLTFNSIQSYNAFFPNLELLDLGYNDLTEIPPVVFSHTKLTGLKLAGNALRNVTLTNDQATFLANLKNFTIDDASISKECYVTQQREVRGYKFCIVAKSSSDSEGASSGTKASSSSSPVPLILAIVGGVVVLAAVIGVIVYRRRRHTGGKRTDNNHTTTNGGDATLSSHTGTTNYFQTSAAVALWNDPELLAIRVNSEDIRDVKRIGKGAYAEVWLVEYRKTQLLASKRLRKADGNASSTTRTQEFIAEIKLVAKLEHPKIVQFVAIAWTLEADLQALFEYMDGGDLRSYLESDSTPRHWTPEKVQIAIDVVEALVYVHSFAPPLIHRDLKSRNVLLSRQGDAKLTDFGVARYRSENNTMTAGVGTGRWLAPEVIAGTSDYGPAADIFSFGAVLSELDTHKLPYDGVVGPNGHKLADVALLQLISTGQLRPSFCGPSTPEPIVELAHRCFALNPLVRPTATELAYALRNFKRTM